MTPAIRMTGLRKTFGTKVAVERLDLTIPRGTLTGFIGPNGAGKTTTIRMVMAIIFPDAGQLEVLGRASAFESKDQIGYLPEERGLYRKMRVGGFLQYMARLKGVAPAEARRRTRQWLDRVELADCYKKKCEELSKGMQQKVQFIAAVIHDPELIILDEPFSGLDPVNARLMRELIDDMHRQGKTIIFSTHVMSHAERICDHVVMIHQGRKMLDASLPEIRARYDPRTIVFEPAEAGSPTVREGSHIGSPTVREGLSSDMATADTRHGVAGHPEADTRHGVAGHPASPSSRSGFSCDPRTALAHIHGIESLTSRDGAWEARVHDSADPRDIMARIFQAMPVTRIELHKPTLEDIFIDIVKSTAEPTAAANLRAALRESAAEVGADA